MKLPAVAITLALIPIQLHAGAIAQKELDEFVIYNLPVAFKSGNTTVLFPSAISGLVHARKFLFHRPGAETKRGRPSHGHP